LPEIRATAVPKQGAGSGVNSCVFSETAGDFHKGKLSLEEIGWAQPEVVVFSHCPESDALG